MALDVKLGILRCAVQGGGWGVNVLAIGKGGKGRE